LIAALEFARHSSYTTALRKTMTLDPALITDLQVALQADEFAEAFGSIKAALCRDDQTWQPLFLFYLLTISGLLAKEAGCFCSFAPSPEKAASYQTVYVTAKATAKGYVAAYSAGDPAPTAALLQDYMANFDALKDVVVDVLALSCTASCKAVNQALWLNPDLFLGPLLQALLPPEMIFGPMKSELTTLYADSTDCFCGIDYVRLLSFASPTWVLSLMTGFKNPVFMMQYGKQVTAAALSGICSADCQAMIAGAVGLGLGLVFNEKMISFLEAAHSPPRALPTATRSLFSAALAGAALLGAVALVAAHRRRRAKLSPVGAAAGTPAGSAPLI